MFLYQKYSQCLSDFIHIKFPISSDDDPEVDFMWFPLRRNRFAETDHHSRNSDEIPERISTALGILAP